MTNLQMKLEAFIEDVNQEESRTLQVFENILNMMFFLVKWAGIPFICYLLYEFSRL